MVSLLAKNNIFVPAVATGPSSTVTRSAIAPGAAARALTTPAPKCSTCVLKERCLPRTLGTDEPRLLDKLITGQRKVQRGDSLYRAGAAFHTLYVVRLGHFKTCNTDMEGGRHITGLHMSGELLGLDAIADGRYISSAVALDDAQVCEIPYPQLEAALATMPLVLSQFHRMLSDAIVRHRSMLHVLACKRPAPRFAAFLLDLSARYAARGYASARFELRLSRKDTASYLSLSAECVSRQVSAFRQQGWIEVSGRQVRILDVAALRAQALADAPEQDGGGRQRRAVG